MDRVFCFGREGEGGLVQQIPAESTRGNLAMEALQPFLFPAPTNWSVTYIAGDDGIGESY